MNTQIASNLTTALGTALIITALVRHKYTKDVVKSLGGAYAEAARASLGMAA